MYKNSYFFHYFHFYKKSRSLLVTCVLKSHIHVRPVVFCWLMSDKIFRFVLDEFFILEFFYTDQIIKGCFGTFLHVRLVCTPKCTPIEHVKFVNAFLGSWVAFSDDWKMHLKYNQNTHVTICTRECNHLFESFRGT